MNEESETVLSNKALGKVRREVRGYGLPCREQFLICEKLAYFCRKRDGRKGEAEDEWGWLID